MQLILDGSPNRYAKGYQICLRHLFRSRAVINLDYFQTKTCFLRENMFSLIFPYAYKSCSELQSYIKTLVLPGSRPLTHSFPETLKSIVAMIIIISLRCKAFLSQKNQYTWSSPEFVMLSFRMLQRLQNILYSVWNKKE